MQAQDKSVHAADGSICSSSTLYQFLLCCKLTHCLWSITLKAVTFMTYRSQSTLQFFTVLGNFQNILSGWMKHILPRTLEGFVFYSQLSRWVILPDARHLP